VSGLKTKSELLADQIRSQSSEIGENENFLDGQSEKIAANSLLLQSVKKETSEKAAQLKGITQELAEQMDKYEMPIEKRMEENSWRKKHDELRKFINQEVIPKTGLDLSGMFEAFQKKQKDLQRDERSR
jgi:N6-adenosine-specific RNA methylase IME4